MTDMLQENKIRQNVAITDHSGNMLVSASAGSGKTYTMIERIIDIILKGEAHVDEILAVTFTKSAAQEMKDRLKIALSKAVADGKKELNKELRKVASASISTIDSFCADLVRTYFFEVDVDPDFEIIDKNEATILKNKVIDNLFEEKYESKDEDFYELLQIFSRNRMDDDFKELIIKLTDKANVEEKTIGVLRDNLSNFTEEFFKEMLNSFKQRFNVGLNKKIVEIDEITNKAKKLNIDKLVSASGYCVDAYKELVKNGDIYSLVDFKLDSAANKPRMKDPDFAAAELLDSYAALKNSATKLIKDTKKGLTNYDSDLNGFLDTKKDTELLVKLIEEYAFGYAEKKKEYSKLDFSDLSCKAYEILKNNEIRDRVAGKYKYIFIDEYQDVNGLQEAIFKSLDRNNLFMVGDLKQSIYGFRGCNSVFFANKTKEYKDAADKKLIELVVNHRSAPNILDYCNFVFTKLMKENADMPYSPLVTYGGYGKYRGECKFYNVVGGEEKVEPDRVYSVQQDYEKGIDKDEASKVGIMVKQIINDIIGSKYYAPPKDRHEPMDVFVDDPDNLKTVTYGDIAILVGEFNEKAESMLEVLRRAGIPVTTQGEFDLGEYPEIKQLINVLKLIDCYSSDIPLASTLKLVAGLNEEELIEIRKFAFDRRATFFDAYQNALKKCKTELGDKLKKFDAYYTSLRQRAGILSVCEILQKVIRENDLDLKWGSMKLGEFRLERVNAFLNIVESLGDYEVCAFLKKAENGDCLSVNEVGGENAVTVTTIHKSKGLEYPIVILANIQNEFNKRDFQQETVFYSRNYGLSLKTYDRTNRKVKDNLYRRFFAESMGDFLRYEKVRLFYVALTRAKYSMYLVASRANKNLELKDVESANSFFDFLECTDEYAYTEVDVSKLDFRSVATDEKEICLNDGDEDLKRIIKNNLAFRYSFDEDISLPEKSSVTALTQEADKNDDYVPVLYNYEDDEALDKIARGVAYHKYLELYDFDKRILTKELNKEDSAYIDEEKIGRILDLHIFKDLQGYSTYKEKKFMANISAAEIDKNYTGKENMVVQGTIDLLAIKDDKAIIVDYKFSNKDTAELVKRYAKQLELYKKAVEISLNVKVEKTILVNLQTEEIINI